MPKITHTEIRMYRMGTGDCFILKFFAGQKLNYKMMIDCGTWSGSKETLTPYIEDLKTYVDNHVDLLVVTHEHKDHVHVFDACKDLFTNDFSIDKIWMAWTENDSTAVVKRWKKDYGDKKKALALAADKLKNAISDPVNAANLDKEFNGLAIREAMQDYANVVGDFSALQMDKNAATGDYVGGLAGMQVVKELLAKDNIEYYSPGDIIENIANLSGIKFFVLGPPLSWEEVSEEAGGKGESYDHNKELAKGDAFAAAILSSNSGSGESVMAFDKVYEESATGNTTNTYAAYNEKGNEWRKIDNDWLSSAGSLALRMNSITNNLSLALAIEFEDSGKVMLFPGDAEYGSWLSWHSIKWTVPSKNKGVSLTEDLLNRTVFYKVAHHLSHNGTAERLGMDMMIDKNLVAMATLDYNIISPNWKNTMPNRALLKDLVAKTKGRLMVMNDAPLFYDIKNTVKLSDKIVQEKKKLSKKEAKDFEDSLVEDPKYFQFTVNGK